MQLYYNIVSFLSIYIRIIEFIIKYAKTQREVLAGIRNVVNQLPGTSWQIASFYR